MKPDSKYMTLEDLRKKQQSDPRYMSAADLNARLEDKKRKEEERVRKEEERVRKEQEKLEIQEKQKPTARYEDPKDPISNYQKSLNAIDEINKSLGISTPKKTMPFKRDEKIHSDLDTTPEERKLEFKPEEKSTKTYSEPEEYTEPKPFSKATAVAAKIGAEYMVGFEKGINTLVDFGFGIMANAARTFGKDDKAELYDMARAYVYESKYKQASRELDDFLSPKAREGHLLQKASQFTGELAGLVTFSFLGDKATEGLFKVFSGGSTGAAISTLTENAATGTAQQVANKTGKIVTRVGGAAARYLYTRGSSMSELLEKGYTYDEAAKVANIYSGISAGLDLTTNVVYGAFSTTLLKDFTDKTVVNGTEIIIQELTKKEMITSELLRTLKVANVEALKGVARSATKNELERMILDPTKLGYFKNENGEISLTRAGQDYLVNFVISSIVQTPGRIKNIEAFDKYQSQLMTDAAKQVDLSKASRIEISKSVKKGDSVKASPIVRTPENEQFLNSILDAAKKDGIDLTEGMNIGDGVDIVYDPDLRYEIVRTDGTKIEVHGGFKYVFEKDYHVNIQQEKNDVPKISVKEKSTDVGADYIKITNDIVSSDNPVDVKVNLLEHQISGLNNVLVSNIKITPKLMKDVYTNKQTLIKAKEELLSKASDTELNIIYAGSKAAEYSAKTAPDSDNKAQIIDEIQKEKENVATLLDKDRDIKLITNKATVEKEFTENTTGAIDILNKLNENRPENDKIKFVQDYTEDQQLAVDVGSAFGKQVFFIENSNFSGFTVDTNPNVLFIDSKPVNALIKDQNSAFTYVVGHELFHSLKEVDPVTYNSFMRYIYTEVNAEQVLNFIDKYDPTATLNTINALKINGKLNMDELIKNPHEYLPQTTKLLEIVEEMAANEFGGILTTPDFWIGMNNRDSKVAERLSDIAGRMIDKINEPVYDSPLTQVQVDRIKNKFLDIISGIEEKETEKVAKPKLPVKKEVEPHKIETKETVSEPIKVKEEPVRKLPIKKVEPKKVTPKKEVVSEPVTKTVSKIAEKATGKKPSSTVRSNTIKRLSEQKNSPVKRDALTKYYISDDYISFTDGYSTYRLNKNTEMPIEKGSAKDHADFYHKSMKVINERIDEYQKKDARPLDIDMIKFNKKTKANIDLFASTKNGVTFIDNVNVNTDKLIDAIRILGTDLTYRTSDDWENSVLIRNSEGESALILGIMSYDESNQKEIEARRKGMSSDVEVQKPEKKLPTKPPIKKTTKEDIDHLFKEKQSDIPQKTTKEDLDLKLDMIKDNFKVFLDFKDRDILNTVIKDFNQYKKEGGTGSVSDLDSYMATKDKTIADWKDRLKASGVNIKELPKKQTKLYQSLQNSPNEKIATDIIKLYNEGKIIIEHKTQSNPETYEKAMQKLLVDQEGAIHNFFHETNEITPEAVAMGDILLQYYSHTGDLDEMANVWTRLHPLGTTTGRTLQMFSNLQKTTPEGYIHIVYKELDKINEILKSSNDPIIRAWIRENAGGIILEDYEQDVLYTMTKAMFGLNQDDSKRNILESQIMKIINDKIPKGWVEKGLTLHRDAMLGNMRTPGRNWMGNVPTLPFNILSQKHVGVKLDKYLSKKTGIRTMGELKNKRKHYLEGIKQAVTDFKLEINTNPTNAFERQSGKAFDDDAHFGKLMNNIDRLVSFNMDVGDRGFFNVYYRGELDAFRELNGGKPPTDLQKQIATERAEKLTWKNHGRLYEFTRSARNLLNYVHFSDGKINVGFDDMNKGTPVFGIGNVVLPFIMTPANLTVSLYDFSPLSFGSVMLAKHKFDKAIESGNHEQIFRAQRNLNERLGYAISGTVMWLIGGLLIAASKKSKKFKVTADYDSKVKQLQRDIGWQPYAFQIEDSFYTYSWSEPAGTALGVLAEIDRKKAEKLAKGEKLDLFESFRSMLSTMGDSMLEQSYLIALSDLFGRSKYSRMDDGEMEGFARNIRDTAGNAAMQFVPSFVRSLSNYLDSTYKETYEKDAFGKSLSGRILGNIPGLKGTLPSKKNLFGDTAIIGGVKRNPVTRFFNTMLTPANVSKSNYYPEYTELMRIYQTTGTTDFMPREVTNEIVYKDKTITLTAKQKTEIQEQMGKIYHKALTGLMRNSIYSDATSFEKAKLLNGLSLYSRDKAIEEVGLFENYELKKGTMAEKIQRYQDSGLSIESALLYHGIINSLDTNSQKAKSIMDMTVSQKEKDIMLRLVSPTAKTSPTSSDLGHLDTDVDFDAYYSLLPAKREQHSKYGKYFNIKIDTFASAIKDISKIESKKDTAGKTIPNSKRDQVRAYIEKLPNLSAAQKLYLYNTVGYTINTEANSKIMYKYIESLSLSVKDKVEIWNALGFK